MTPLQLRFLSLLSSLPWWFPTLFIGAGITAYVSAYLDRGLTTVLPTWANTPTTVRFLGAGGLALSTATFGLLGLGAIARTTGATSLRWYYAVLMLLFARAIEGGLSLYLLRSLYAKFDSLRQDSPKSDTSKLSRALDALWILIRRRLIRWVLGGLILLGGLVMFVALLVWLPGVRPLVAFVVTWSLTTGALALLSTAWALRKFPSEFGFVERTAVALTVVGGEMYNVPTSIELVTTPLVGGPLSTALPTAVNSLGYLVGATVVFIQLHTRVLNGLLKTLGRRKP